jgi:hypothetical protein
MGSSNQLDTSLGSEAKMKQQVNSSIGIRSNKRKAMRQAKRRRQRAKAQ